MSENEPRYKKFGPNFEVGVVGDLERMVYAHSRHDEYLSRASNREASNYWHTIKEHYRERGFLPEEFAELSAASKEELDMFRAELEFGAQSFEREEDDK